MEVMIISSSSSVQASGRSSEVGALVGAAEGTEVGALVGAAEGSDVPEVAFKITSGEIIVKHRLAHIAIFSGERLLSQLSCLQRQNVIPITNPPVTNEAIAALRNNRQREAR
jgi:hypothetical protein